MNDRKEQAACLEFSDDLIKLSSFERMENIRPSCEQEMEALI